MKMHSYQNQINRMGKIIKLEVRARQNGYWIEAISLSYALLEFQLRLLLRSDVGEEHKLIDVEEINKARFLISLANIAKEKGFIDDTLYKKIEQFNNIRRGLIHKLFLEDIDYSALENQAKDAGGIYQEIESKWLKITWGKEERFVDGKWQ
jgi:hypothetical protein